MKAICKNNSSHNSFLTTAHVAQLWKVDDEGNFIEEVEACSDVTHKPHPDNEWACAVCDSDVTVEG